MKADRVVVDWHIADQARVLSVEPSDMTVSSVGDVVVFSCQLDGTPTPHVQWYRDTDVISGDDDDDDADDGDNDDEQHYVVHSDSGLSVLEIHTVSGDDAGYFRCRASNDIEQSVVSRFVRLSFNTTASPTNHCMYLRSFCFRAMLRKRGLSRHAVSVCLPVCVCHVRGFCQNE